MPVPSVALVHWIQKVNPDGESPVWVRVSHARKSSYFTQTGVSVRARDWNGARRSVRASHALATAYNAKLSDLVAHAKVAALGATCAADVVAALKGEGQGSLSSFLDRYILLLGREEKVWEEKKYRTLRAKLQASLGWPLTWASLTPDRLSVFETHLRVKLGNGQNMVRKELSRLHQVVRRAIREGELEAGADPFARFRLPKAAPISRRRLTSDEVGKIFALGPDDGVAIGSRLAAVRDLFALQFYTAGARISDALQFTPASVQSDAAGARLVYRMMKTSALQSIRIPPPATPVVKQLTAAVEARDPKETARFGTYLVPLLKRGDDTDPVSLRRRIASATTVANALLKTLAQLAEVDDAGLSSHVARHSFADLARQSGDLYAVSKALGHSSLGTTQVYLAGFDQTAVDDLTDSLWK